MSIFTEKENKAEQTETQSKECIIFTHQALMIRDAPVRIQKDKTLSDTFSTAERTQERRLRVQVETPVQEQSCPPPAQPPPTDNTHINKRKEQKKANRDKRSSKAKSSEKEIPNERFLFELR